MRSKRYWTRFRLNKWCRAQVCCFACTRRRSAATLSHWIDSNWKILWKIDTDLCSYIELKVDAHQSAEWFHSNFCGSGCGCRKHFTSLFGTLSNARMYCSQTKISNWQWSNQIFEPFIVNFEWNIIRILHMSMHDKRKSLTKPRIHEIKSSSFRYQHKISK